MNISLNLGQIVAFQNFIIIPKDLKGYGNGENIYIHPQNYSAYKDPSFVLSWNKYLFFHKKTDYKI